MMEMETKTKKKLQPVIRISSFIELLFYKEYNSNKRFCQEKIEQKFDKNAPPEKAEHFGTRRRVPARFPCRQWGIKSKPGAT